jgi:hypothetical protein
MSMEKGSHHPTMTFPVISTQHVPIDVGCCFVVGSVTGQSFDPLELVEISEWAGTDRDELPLA